ncbi:MAG: DUF2252 family protein [Candidatus Solibacter sp.]|nr:DUF2252 family protein [Candidatus Solibacter sp.]
MNIHKATAEYEDWLSRHVRLLAPDLAIKHEQMRTAPFPFLRATFYRWAQVWPEICEEAAKAPVVLAVGDLHVENFGTWRDSEGRLIWGINDFDEAWRLPYTSDLIRLATSALLAPAACGAKPAVDALLRGYMDGLGAGGRPFALAEHHNTLRTVATARLHAPEDYWEKLRALPEVEDAPPAGALKAIARMMPEGGLHWHIVHRVAGLGSLGRERYAAIADWRGGSIAREAKALAPSACIWAREGKGTAAILYQEILDSAIRCRDPFVRLQKRWIVRRLAPDCSRIELADMPKERHEIRLLRAMGWETANVHLGSAKARELLGDLKKRPRNWLLRAAQAMEKSVRTDFKAQEA